MYVYVLVGRNTWIPEQFFHSFQEAEDNVTGRQRIMRLTLGRIGYDIYVNGGWTRRGI